MNALTITTSVPSGSRVRGVVECFVESVRAECAHTGKARIVLHRRLRIDHGCQTRCVRGDDEILTQAAFEPEARHAEVGILIGEFQIARAIRRFGNSPRNVQRCTVARSAGAR